MKQNNALPTLVVLYACAFVAAFNENIINVALVDIMAEFDIGSAASQWLVTGYMIVTTIMVTVMAFLYRRFALRQLFFAGAGFLVVASALCMVAPSFPSLLVCRLLQAVGTGIFIPVMMNTVLAVAPHAKLGTYLSIGGCMITFGPAFAPVVSGLVVTMLGWRAIFALPIVAMAALVLVGARLVGNVADPQRISLDVVSLALSAVGLTAFVYGLSELTSNLTVALVALVVGLVVMGAFVWRQSVANHPLLDLSPLLNKRFATACVLVVVAMMTTFSMSVLLPLYFQGSLGVTAFAAGALILVPIVVNAVTALVGGRIMDGRGEWPLLPAGFLLIAVGQVAVAVAGAAAAMLPVVLGAIVVYAGVGLVFSPSQTAGLKHLNPRQNPHGVAIMNTFIQMAACIGPSLFVGILASSQSSALAAGSEAALAQAAGFASAVAVAAAIAACGFFVALAFAWKARAAARAQDAVGGQGRGALAPGDARADGGAARQGA